MDRPQEEIRVGVIVRCAVCGDMKKPIGRSGPLGVPYCEPPWERHGCAGYWQDPKPGSLWPGERSDEFGYPVGTDGTEPLAARQGGPQP